MENFDYDLRSVQETRNLARLGKIATDKLADYTDEQIDRILRNMVRVAEENAVMLGQMASEETGFGKPQDKAFKNHMASTLLYEQIKDMKVSGIISEDPINKVMEVAQPVGLIMGIVPSTNPTSTVIYKSMIAVKARNAIVFSPHPSAVKCTTKAAQLMAEAAVAAGAPENTVGCQTLLSREATNELMTCNEVKMILATGGPGMVKAAYSAGKPALGVGAGNSPAYFEKTCDIEQGVRDTLASKGFDNGTICASEQSIIVEECNRDAVIAEFKKQGGYFMTKEETAKVCKILFKKGTSMSAAFVGRSAEYIAKGAGISIPAGTKLLIGEQEGVGPDYPLSYEKLTSVVGFYTVRDCNEALELSIKLLQHGLGHTMNIKTKDEKVVKAFSKVPASRILVNTGGTQGGTGACTNLPIGFTLGCGTQGGSATSDNVSPINLINVNRVVYGVKDTTTLGSSDAVFQSVLNGTYGSPASMSCGCEAQSPLTYSACCGGSKIDNSVSPANQGGSLPTANSKPIDGQDLMNMVNEIIAAMKSGK